jgi:hypothetical protein
MKFNGDVDLRQRARRKWLVVLACLLVAGGVWYGVDQKKEKRSISLQAGIEQKAAPSSTGDATLVLADESVANPFNAPTVAFGEPTPISSDALAQVDIGNPLNAGMERRVLVPSVDPWLGPREKSDTTRISFADRPKGGNGFAIEPQVIELSAPVIPPEIEPVRTIMPLPPK